MGHYILNEMGEPVVEPDLMTWAAWFEENNGARVVAKTKIADDIEVSTVFLAIDHSYSSGPPILYETMVFGGPLDQTQDRYATRAAAVRGHREYVERVRAALSDTD
jgi:hypothetical protein